MKIKYRKVNKDHKGILIQPKKGGWIDLYSDDTVQIDRPRKLSRTNDVDFNIYKVSLGIAVELPKYFEAVINPRSSTLDNFGVILSNHQGVVDDSYIGNDDIWSAKLIGIRNSEIKKNDRILQFRIQPNQFAPIWVKLKWLFTNKIEFIEVNSLGNPNRGGFGTTGK